MVQFLWIPGHIGITGNEIADRLAKDTIKINNSPVCKIPFTDIIPHSRKIIWKAWNNKWADPNNKVSLWHKKISPIILKRHGFKILRSQIISFSRLRTGHNLLPLHAFRLSLNSSPLCTWHSYEADCDARHILFECPAFVAERNILRASLGRLEITRELDMILSSFSPIIVPLILKFFSKSGFRI